MSTLVEIRDELDNQIYQVDVQIKKLHLLSLDFARGNIWQEIINRYDMTRIQLRTARRLIQENINEQDKIRANQHNVDTD